VKDDFDFGVLDLMRIAYAECLRFKSVAAGGSSEMYDAHERVIALIRASIGMIKDDRLISKKAIQKAFLVQLDERTYESLETVFDVLKYIADDVAADGFAMMGDVMVSLKWQDEIAYPVRRYEKEHGRESFNVSAEELP
jgi:hypothetical protein